MLLYRSLKSRRHHWLLRIILTNFCRLQTEARKIFLITARVAAISVPLLQKNSSTTHYFTHNIGNSSSTTGGNSSCGSSSSGSSSSTGIDSGVVDCESEVVVLDFETTGLSSQKHRVIEVAAVILHGDKAIIRRFIYYILLYLL